MAKTANWFSNKDNIKIAFVGVLSLVLIAVLMNSMSGGKDAKKTATSPALYKTAAGALSPPARHTLAGKVLKRDKTRQTMKDDIMKAPPFLQRDLFSYRKQSTNPKRNADQKEIVNLQLTATIIDGQGALAIIGDEVLGVGAMVKSYQVTSIKQNEVILSRGSNQYVLGIKEE